MIQSSRKIFIATAVVLSAYVSACQSSDAVTSPNPSSDLIGTWSRNGNVVGSSLGFALSAADTTLSGTGTFAIEAGMSGTLTVTGVRSGSTVNLVLLTNLGVREHFNGSLTGPDAMSGWFWVENQLAPDSVATSFTRTAH